MTSHGVNNAQAIKTAAILWRFTGSARLRKLSNTRMASIDRKYGVATGLLCADESVCGEPWNPSEFARKSPSRGTEMCAVVESMFSYNEMFSILGGVADADRAERIAINALPATWAAPEGGTMWNHQYFQAVNQVKAINVTEDKGHEHLYQDGDSALETYFGGGDNGGCCTANNGQGWPKYALRVAYRTAGGGVAIGAYAPIRVQLAPSTALLVHTDYPFDKENRVEILIRGPLSKATPLLARVPQWATAAKAWHNGEPVPTFNGTMLEVTCSATPDFQQLCNLTLQMNPEVRLESWYGDSVSVLRGSLLFSGYIGNKFIDYATCEDSPHRPQCKQLTQGRPPQSKWYGVMPEQPFNVALVIANRSNLAASFTVDGPGLRCAVTPSTASWPECALDSPSTCTRVCDTPFNHSSFPLTLSAQGRLVKSWGMADGSQIEADPPPASPACSTPGSCAPPAKILLVPHGATALRVGSFPVA